MKVLSIHHYPNAEATDFCWASEGEIAVPTTPCVRSNPNCGCDRSHTGITSRRASTTLMVREVSALTADDLTPAMAASAAVAVDYPTGTVLRPRYDDDTESWHYSTVGDAA